jgi:hypothetical protein
VSAPEHAAGPLLAVAGWTLGAAATIAGGVFAATSNLDTGLITGGAAGLLGFLFRSWFKENKRNTDETWNHADEYRIERDYYRLESQHWQARWVALVQGHDDVAETIPQLPNLDAMKAEARQEKEASSGRRR